MGPNALAHKRNYLAGETLPRKGKAPLGLPRGASERARAAMPADAYWRSTSIFLISPMAFAGFSPLGQVRVQFMMVWHR